MHVFTYFTRVYKIVLTETRRLLGVAADAHVCVCQQQVDKAVLIGDSIVLLDANGLAAVAESHFTAATVQTRTPAAMLEVRGSWQHHRQQLIST